MDRKPVTGSEQASSVKSLRTSQPGKPMRLVRSILERLALGRGTPVRVLLISCMIGLSGCHTLKSMPEGTSMASAEHPTTDISFYADRTWVDATGERHVEQQVFDEMFALIDGARKLIVLDMFLFNDWQGPIPETTRALSGELTRRLIKARQQHPGIQIVIITDPVNTLYNGLASEQFDALNNAGVRLVQTDLNRLRDSNTFYSPFWRLLFKPFGNSKGSLLPNPIGPGRVSVRTYMKLFNFKANHRKTLVVDQGEELIGFVSSANPHDGSSAHRNVAIRFSGPAVIELLHSENAVLEMSEAELVDVPAIPVTSPDPATGSVTLQLVTENEIELAILQALNSAQPGDQIDLMMFYLSDRHVIRALIEAHDRGVNTRIMLDPNKDAFGREKNGVPNRPVARKLHRNGLDVRWCNSKGEQCHTKMLVVNRASGSATIISGSANFTRRNLDDFNLETDVVIRGPKDAAVINDARSYFDEMWTNDDGRLYSTDYAAYEDNSLWHRFLGWFMESSGISSF